MGTDSLPTTPKKPKATPIKVKVTPKSRGKGKDVRSDTPTNELGNDNGVLPSEMDQKSKSNTKISKRIRTSKVDSQPLTLQKPSG